MRKAPTWAESTLWNLLRKKQVQGLKFRRQVPLGPYIVDFMCFRHRLIIEADGPFHDDDTARDRWLTAQGFRILRFPNDTIVQDKNAVLAAILRTIEAPGTLIDQLRGDD
jgi:very-short-patch-repair endonuclease